MNRRPAELDPELGSKAKVQIIDYEGGPRLFTEDLAPGALVLFGADEALHEVEVRFAGGQAPLDGVGSSFRFEGGPVTYRLEPTARGIYPFVFVVVGTVIELTMKLEVTDHGSCTRTGFFLGSDGIPGQQCYLSTGESVFELQILNRTAEDQTLRIALPGSAGAERVTIAVGEQRVQLPITAGGVAATIQLASSRRRIGPGMQAGGTEQVEVVIEPD